MEGLFTLSDSPTSNRAYLLDCCSPTYHYRAHERHFPHYPTDLDVMRLFEMPRGTVVPLDRSDTCHWNLLTTPLKPGIFSLAAEGI